MPTTFLTVGNTNSDSFGGFIDMLDQLRNLASGPPLVITTSYGFDETAVAADTQMAESIFLRSLS